MSEKLGAAAVAAAFVILFDTVGSGPTFTKGQVVPAEELAFLGIERLLEAGAIVPYDPAPPPAPEPTETERLQAEAARFEAKAREAFARVKALEADLAGVNRDRERLERELQEERDAHEATRHELEAAHAEQARLGAGVEEARADAGRWLDRCSALGKEIAALKASASAEEPKPDATSDPKPADKPAKKGS